MFLSFIVFFYKDISKDNVLVYLIIFFIVQSSLAVYASKGMQVQGRYALIPGILLIFVVLRLYNLKNSILKFISISFISLSIITGLYEYKYNNKYPHFLICIDCPEWKEEVKIWKVNQSYELKIWDYPRKKMELIRED